MKTRPIFWKFLACSVTLLSMAQSAQAEIYKWVDEQGRTHYSSNQADAERAKGKEVKIAPAASPKETERSYWDYVTGKKTQTPQIPQPSESPPVAAATPRPAKNYEGTSDAARCEYARDVLNGTLKLTNGEPMDEHERQTAEADVRRFCR